MLIKRLLIFILLLLPLIYLTLFFFYPLLTILQISLIDEGRFAWSGIETLIGESYYLRLIGFTSGQALLSTILTMLVGLPAAYVFARYDFRAKTIVRAILTVPFVLPTVVVAVAFNALLGPRGVINGLLAWLMGTAQGPLDLQYSFGMILLAHVFYNIAVIIRIVGGFWATLDPHLTEAGAMLGANRWRQNWEITLPVLAPALLSAALLVFLFTFSSFGVILILGGPRYATLEVEIYRQAVSIFNLPLAATLSIIQIAFSLVITTIYTQVQSRATVPLQLRSQRSTGRPLRTTRGRVGALVAVGSPTLFVLLPLLALFVRSVWVGDGFGLDYYIQLAVNERRSIVSNAPLTAIANSFLFAAITTLLSLGLGGLAAYLLMPVQGRRGWRGWVEPLFLLPLGTSAVTLGLGFIVALDEPPLNLRTSALLIPIAHSLIAFPFVMRAILPVLRSIPPTLREAAAVLGASPVRQRWEIDLPIIARALIVGAVFAFAISMGEFGATALIRRPEWPTLPVVIFDYLGRPGLLNYGRALAMSFVLMSTTATGFILIERFRGMDNSEF